jgi:hypothetical protein
MILLNPFELQKTEFENKAKQLSEELAKTEEYILVYSSLKKRLTSEYKFYKSLSEPVVKLLIENKSSSKRSYIKGFCNIKNLSGELIKINVHIGELEDFKGGKDDKKALEIARKKVDDYIQSNLSKFFSEK